MSSRCRWRALSGCRRLLLLAVAVCVVCMWFWILSSDDYDVFDHVDIENDPIYKKTHNQQKNVQHHQELNMIGQFPVVRGSSRRQTVTQKPYIEDDVIPSIVNAKFTDKLKKAIDGYPSQNLIVSVIDYGFIEFAINFIKGSIEALNLQSTFLPVCLDAQSVQILEDAGYTCVILDLHQNGSLQATDFGTEEYYRKTNIKTWVVLQFLKFGKTVLISDVDIVLFKDPFHHFSCGHCDIEIQMDRQLYNSGFVYTKATRSSIILYQLAWDLYLQYHIGHDQAYVNMAITAMRKNKTIQLEELSSRRFPCGAYYFEHDYRHFYNKPACVDCVMAHNNYLGTSAAKIYRFKENLLWNIDNNGYYSSTKANYLTYENPYDFGKDTITYEKQALLNALIISKLLNRVLILPSFRCCNCKTLTCDHPINRCSLLSIVKLKAFDSIFKGRYREHSFLRNIQVSRIVKDNISPTVHLNRSLPAHNDISNYLTDILQNSANPVEFKNQTWDEISVMNILNNFSPYRVIRFNSLYGEFAFDDLKDDNGLLIVKRFSEGIQCGLYEQWEVSMEEKFFGRRKVSS